MPLYVADYLADTAHLSAAESGAYLHLIMHYWIKGGLPNDHQQLAKIARMSLKLFNRSVPVLAPFFGPNWTHKRIDQELIKTREISEKRRSAVQQRRDRSDTSEPTNVEQMNTQSQSHIQIQVLEETISRPKQPKGCRLPSDWQPREHQDQILELDKFRDYWVAQPGQKGVKTDWDATWRNWIRRAAERKPVKQSFNRIQNAAMEMLDVERNRNQGSWSDPVFLPIGKSGGD